MNHPTRRASLVAIAAASGVAGLHAEGADVEAGGGRIELIFDGAFAEDAKATLRQWVQRAADTLVAYLGHFPLERVELYARAAEGRGPRRGTTFAEPEPFVSVHVGSESRSEDLANDWILVHEFVHLAVPRVRREQRWLHEGLATYAEGVARARVGWTDAGQFWAEMVRGLPQGLPAAGDAGLDRTPTWGRTYWGGALFCLLADVESRRRGAAAGGVRAALQSLRPAGGSYAVTWTVAKVLSVFDAAVGSPTFSELYAAMKDKPAPTDLPALWRQLGISVAAGERRARFDEQAPLAAVRRAILA